MSQVIHVVHILQGLPKMFISGHHNQTGDHMDKDEIFVEIKLRIGESKYGDEAEAVSVQAYEGDELDRKFGGFSQQSSLDGKTILVTYPIKLTKLRNKKYSKLN